MSVYNFSSLPRILQELLQNFTNNKQQQQQKKKRKKKKKKKNDVKLNIIIRDDFLWSCPSVPLTLHVTHCIHTSINVSKIKCISSLGCYHTFMIVEHMPRLETSPLWKLAREDICPPPQTYYGVDICPPPNNGKGGNCKSALRQY